MMMMEKGEKYEKNINKGEKNEEMAWKIVIKGRKGGNCMKMQKGGNCMEMQIQWEK